MLSKGSGNPKHDLNHMSPAAANAKLGDRLDDLITQHNLVVAKLNALLAALVAASGASVPAITAVTALAVPVVIPALGSNSAPEIPGDRP
jgi:hypothetical protein